MIKLKDLDLLESRGEFQHLPEGKLLINTINAHSFNTAQTDAVFADALLKGDVLMPDGLSIVWACKWLNAKSHPKQRCAGWDLFVYEMKKLQDSVSSLSQQSEIPFWKKNTPDRCRPVVMFMGSSEQTLALVKKQAAKNYPDLDIVTFSPPYSDQFSTKENDIIVSKINEANPDLLWIGMTAPKQEKWAYTHWNELDIHCHCGTIGAVFDFFAGTRRRAPMWLQEKGFEWLYRLLQEPRRMYRRYCFGNPLFIWNVCKEKIFQ